MDDEYIEDVKDLLFLQSLRDYKENKQTNPPPTVKHKMGQHDKTHNKHGKHETDLSRIKHDRMRSRSSSGDSNNSDSDMELFFNRNTTRIKEVANLISLSYATVYDKQVTDFMDENNPFRVPRKLYWLILTFQHKYTKA